MFTHAKTAITGVVTAAILATGMLVAMPAAQAQGWNQNQQGYNSDWRRDRYRNNDNNGAAAAGIFGLIAGAMIGTALADQHGVAWCEQHYRTYNYNTGSFTGYDGQQHACS
ncbi:MAG: BA14K family protein [Bauldia sp.]